MNVLRTIKIVFCLALLAVGLPAAYGYSFVGPVGTGDNAWQNTSIGYNPNGNLPNMEPSVLTTGPMNIGEEYRPNTPTWYYAYDASFLNYFGSNAVASIDQGFTIINNSFTYTNSIATNSIGVDGFSPTLSEFPDYSQHINTTAYGLGLTDLKSTIMNYMMPQIGLEMPDRYVWAIRNAYLPTPGPPCPLGEEFEIIQRNYGITPSPLTQLQYSPYINDELYTYEIFFQPGCIAPANDPDIFQAVNSPVNPFDLTYTAVASWGLQVGGFYTGLTRDDLAGFRALLSTNTVNYENPVATAQLMSTNIAGAQTITTSNLTTLLLFAATNNPGLTAAQFGVTVTATNTFYTLVTNWVVTSQLTNPPGAPYGTQILVVSSNPVVSYQQQFQDTFGNVITNGNISVLTNSPVFSQQCTNVSIVLNYSPTTPAVIQTIQVSAQSQNGGQFGSGGTVSTNTTLTPVTLNVPSGQYLTLPNIANSCGLILLCDQPFPTVVSVTNLITSATGASGFVGSQSIIYTFTNYTYLIAPIVCSQGAPPASLYQGVGKLDFIQADYDSLLGQFFQPITNNYTMQMITNSQLVVEHFQRVVTHPDILLAAADITGNLPNTFESTLSNPNFVQDNFNQYAGLAGPGTIDPSGAQITFTLNKVGDLFLNGPLASEGLTTNAFLNETTASIVDVVWGSFDATTNAPVVYPTGTSIQNLEYEMLVQVSPAAPYLPNGTHNVAYPATPFAATGGAFTQPFTWSAVGLPSGLTLSPTGNLSGTPTQSGTFDITVTLTDANGRSVSWNYTLTIN